MEALARVAAVGLAGGTWSPGVGGGYRLGEVPASSCCPPLRVSHVGPDPVHPLCLLVGVALTCEADAPCGHLFCVLRLVWLTHGGNMSLPRPVPTALCS